MYDSSENRFPWARVINWVTVFLIAYVLSYFVLMARNVPALDNNGTKRFESAFRLAPTAGRLGPLSIQASQVTVFNYIFYPIDLAYYRLVFGT
ncbi:MAG: hypothetical protein HY735_04385 [Verrucomicrobia bacterium]|nr:hypothetical protein [Verrucomicrobiota bacterium]